MKLLFVILALSVVSLFVIAVAVFVRYRRHKHLISGTMVRDVLAQLEVAAEEEQTVGTYRSD